MPAAAVIPALRVYIKVVAFKTPVVEPFHAAGAWRPSVSARAIASVRPEANPVPTRGARVLPIGLQIRWAARASLP